MRERGADLIDAAQPACAAGASGNIAAMNTSPATAARPADGGEDPLRLFVALWPQPALAQALHGWAAEGAGARALPAQRLHLTLHFLGSVARARLPALRDALRVPSRAFVLEFADCQRWSRRLLVALPHAVPEELRELHASLGQALRGLELPVEGRPFRPHVTLSRHESPGLPPRRTTPLRWPVSGHVLVQSQPASGQVYTVLQHYR
jgi:2'-5' RNA ligase